VSESKRSDGNQRVARIEGSAMAIQTKRSRNCLQRLEPPYPQKRNNKFHQKYSKEVISNKGALISIKILAWFNCAANLHLRMTITASDKGL
jgi:hypothetical protein